MNINHSYYSRYAAAFVRGSAKYAGFSLPPRLTEAELDTLNDNEFDEIIAAGKAADLKLHYFKRTNVLPRVKRVLGFLRSIEIESLLDVGSGRGVFLWPCLNVFPWIEITSIDLLPHRVEMLNTVQQGGVANLSVLAADICDLDIADKSFDVVTMLEVLEHIPDPLAAIKAAVRISKKYVVVTVPSKQDDNPEHIHLLTKDILTELFNQAKCNRLHFDGVPGHLVMTAAREE